MSRITIPMHTYVHDVDRIDGLDTGRYGGKAAGLARMSAAGITVPPAFVIGTDGYRAWRGGGELPEELVAQVDAAVQRLERRSGRRFGAQEDGLPLLVSVRSGAQVSMPGMMDTVLNLGITPRGACALARQSGNASFAADTFVRFWRMFADIVLGVDEAVVGEAAAPWLDGMRRDASLEAFERMQEHIARALAAEGVEQVLAEPRWQLLRAIEAVFESWDSRRAKTYRAHHGIPDDLGTAVTVQAMVFGNLDRQSGSGVAFTRDPNTGIRRLYGEFLLGRQGEDLVSGSATPASLSEPGGLPEPHRLQLIADGEHLERIYRDAVDIEFTVESDKLYFLQVRPAKRTAKAAVRIASDLVDEGLITKDEAVQKVSVEQLKRLLRPEFERTALAEAEVLVCGIGASPGHGSGIAVLDADRAATIAAGGEKIVLLRPTTSPQDIRGMLTSQAIVTARGGALSHAAVVSRALDIPCVVGCDGLEIDPDGHTFRIGGKSYHEGSPLSVDGTTGKVYPGLLPLEPSAGAAEHIERILAWADEKADSNYWVAGVSGPEAGLALKHAPRGFGAIALTDLLIALGMLGDFIETVDELGHHPERKATHDKLGRICYEGCRRLLLASPSVPLDIRLPNLGSPRAQRMIGAWASLAPRLFLPLGLKQFYVPLLRGIVDATRETGHTEVTALVPGVNCAAEVAAFKMAANDAGVLRVGAMLQSPAGLLNAPAMAVHAHALWVDLREIIRTFYGYPSALSFGDDVFDSYVADGYLPYNPRKALGRDLSQLLCSALAGCQATQASVRVGVECGDGAALSLIGELHALGVRTFSVPLAALPSVRLALGQHLCKEAGHG